MDAPVPELAARAARCAERLRASDDLLLASHIDADGLTSAGIASTALERAGVAHDVVFEKQLDRDAVERYADAEYDTVFFTDFGSGQLDVITEYDAFTPVVADHHQPADAETACHLNPLLEGLDGGSELSGAGASYCVARALEGEEADNRDLAALAVVGAVGDMQVVEGELIGANAEIVAEGVAAGVLDASKDLAVFGTQTRPLPKLLAYASDVPIPGITGDRNGALRFLDGLDADLRADGEWKTWADLDVDGRRTVVSALVQRAIRTGVDAAEVEALVGTTYTLTGEEPGSELRDASEFSTLLNATARYDRAAVGLAVCRGERGAPLDAARDLLREHRRTLATGVGVVRDVGVEREANVQWFHAGDRLPETVVGIVAGMAMGEDGVDAGVPIIAFAEKDDGDADADDEPGVKVSMRGTPRLVERGLDLSAVASEAAAAVGGDGGGHEVAAGATVPAGRESDFVAAADAAVGDQLSS
ncbi:RecJ-like exonuclease [Halarchaeum rubridurum]|uniref:RecJ-like exonuclease n=1 Tax=Halarchaeum rubridurum TaxID=489911 RepID=A0A830G3K9_9EURY|nr:DHH family phosphoesterase [Halarchaeum rubridurum]MBP1955802.1 RecJ-like exonuclease [Halarchaeum rubridurum]GGM74352.1 recombinase RecJ [Halarchaeum rubridurum]